MLASKTIWKYIPSDQTLSSETALKLSPMIRQLLAQRGIEHPDDVQQFMKPDLQGLHDPSLLSTIDKVKVRIQTAIDQQEKILIFGDYDADGVTSTTVMYKHYKNLVPIVISISQTGLQRDMVSMKMPYDRLLKKDTPSSLPLILEFLLFGKRVLPRQ